MARFLEYDLTSGRIISEIISENTPEVSENCGLLEIGEFQTIDTNQYAVRNGALVKLYETEAERIERDRLRREHTEQVRKRIKSMTYELALAILDDNNDAVKELQSEFKSLKAYL